MSHLNKKTWLTIGAILVVVGVLVFFLFGGREAAPSSGFSSVGESPLGDTLGRDLLTLLARLKSTELETSLFADQLFLGLRDFGVAITPQPVGRRNPFADFGASASTPKAGAKAAGGAKASSAAPAAKPAAPSPDELDVFDFSFE